MSAPHHPSKPPTPTPTLTIPISCFCALVTGTLTTPTSALPLPLTLCHCTTCRHQSGLLCTSYAAIPKTADFHIASTGDAGSSSLKAYRASEAACRYFCEACGANVLFEAPGADIKDVCTGVLGEGGGVVGSAGSHIFVQDTRDGGMRDWMPGMEAWAGMPHGSAVLAAGWKKGEPEEAAGHEGKEELRAFCQCKGVEFTITRPDGSSGALVAPRGDIVGPAAGNEEDDDAPWWLRDNGTKYLGGTCACRECRLASGFDVQAWAFVPKANIKRPDGSPLGDFDIGTMKRYDSSAGVYREFCGECGATVFWHSDSRPDLIDVSVGLLDADEGARAESWLGWETGRVSFEEEAQNKDLIGRLSAGLKQWGEAKAAS